MSDYDIWLKENSREGTKDDYVDFLVEVEGYTYFKALALSHKY